MKIRLNYWQAVLLFLPYILALAMFDVHFANFTHYQISLVANLLLVLDMLAVVAYQTYLAIGFNNSITKPSRLFQLNAFTPLCFLFIYSLFEIYNSITYHPVNENKIYGPVKISQLPPSGLIIVILLIHTGSTFYLVNNQYVAKKIKSIKDKTEQELLIKEFLNPMKILVKVSLYVLISGFAIICAIDIIRFL